VREAAKDLGVRYVVEGSVRRSGNRLRITAQLIDSTDGSHLWAEKYDRIVDDIFDIQDEITKEIVTALRVNLSDGETALLLNRGTSNVQAWGYCVQAAELLIRYNPPDNAKARELAEKAVGFDPDYASAWAILGFTHWFDSRAGLSGGLEGALSQAAALEEKALALDALDVWVLGFSTMVQLSMRNFERSVATGKRGISLYPGSAHFRAWYGMALLHSGEAQASIPMVKDAIRLNPQYPLWYQSVLARALDCSGYYEDALEEIAAVLEKQPNYFPCLLLRTVILSREGRLDEAIVAVADLQRTNPNFRLAHVPHYLIMRNQEYVDAYAKALRKAGLPE
jgi:tetratricopeptide (TPR) repeat protein